MIYEKILLRNDDENVYMRSYIVDNPLKSPVKRPMVLICPGGSYTHLSPREAEPIALQFNAAGIHAAVVYYSVNKPYPAALEDLSNAVVKVRENAEKWSVKSDKIVVCGFSAGGHVSASLGVFWNSEERIKRADKMNKPNGMILCYPLITYITGGEDLDALKIIAGEDEELLKKNLLHNQVNADCPPAFMWHTFTDPGVPVYNSLYFAKALADNGVNTELHIYPEGPHGLSLADGYTTENWIYPDVQNWIKMAVRWVKKL